MLRAAWMAQELLTTFETELESVTLKPGKGGLFDIRLNDEVIYSRKNAGSFPDIKELKQLIRNRIAPHKSLGHSDSIKSKNR